MVGMNSRGLVSAIAIVLAALAGLSVPCEVEARLTITNVSVHPQFFRPANKEVTIIIYQLSQDAKVTVKIYDESDYLIRTLVHLQSRSKGDNKESWDGTNNTGHPVPRGIYRFTIEAHNKKGGTVLSDLTDITGGEENQVASSEIDVGRGLVTYVLRSPSLVITRLGLGDGGPMLRTLEYRTGKPGGLNQLPWDGFDNSGTVKFINHPKLNLRVEAYSLNANSIVVLASRKGSNAPATPVKMDLEKRHRKKTFRKVIRNHWQHPPERCRDPEVRITLPEGTQRGPDGTPAVSGPVSLRVDVSEQDRLRISEERFEVMFFVDSIFIFEEEAGFFPYNWTWNPQTRSEGLHTITVNVIGYEGHIGSSSLKVRLGK